MGEDTRANLAASLHSTAIDLSEVAAGLADVSTDDGIGKLARILDRIAEEANDGADILRGLIARRKRAWSPLPGSVLLDAPAGHQAAQVADGGTS